MQRDDDDVWRSIVDNYGDRVEIEPDEPSSGQGTAPGPRPEAEASPEQTSEQPPEQGPEGSWTAPFPDADWTQDRFVPPPPPPLPRPPRDRLFAWLGVFGSPTILLVCLVLGIDLPGLVAYFLVASFVVGFLYLVWLMPRGPRDPDDDGAVV